MPSDRRTPMLPEDFVGASPSGEAPPLSGSGPFDSAPHTTADTVRAAVDHLTLFTGQLPVVDPLAVTAEMPLVRREPDLVAVIQRAGGLLSSDRFSELVGIPVSDLPFHTLIMFDHKYPAFFVHEGAILVGVEDVIRDLHLAGLSGLACVDVLTTTSEDLGGISPVELLRNLQSPPDSQLLSTIVHAAQKIRI